MSLFRRAIRPRLVATLAGMAPLVLCAQGTAPSLRVEMVPSAKVQQPQVALGAVAYLSSPDLELLRRAVALPVGMAPRAGESTELDRERLAQWVTRRLGIPAESVQWEGVASTVVQIASQELSADSLVAIAQPALEGHLHAAACAKGLFGARVEVSPISLPSSVFVPVGDTQLRVRPLTAVAPGKRMLVWIDVFAGQRHVKAVPVRFDVSVYAQTALAKGPMGPGETIGLRDIVSDQVDVAHLLSRNGAGGLFPMRFSDSAQEPLTPSQTRTAVKAGDVLSAEKVKPTAAVSRGDRVTLVAHSGLVSLESKVEVLQTGEVGQVVRVKASNGSAPVMAKVIGPGQLELQP